MAVVLLTGVALVGLDDSYATRSYLVVGMTAVCVVTAWALLCTVRGWSTGVFLLVAFLAYPLVGAYTALHNLDYLGLPSASGAGRHPDRDADSSRAVPHHHPAGRRRGDGVW